MSEYNIPFKQIGDDFKPPEKLVPYQWDLEVIRGGERGKTRVPYYVHPFQDYVHSISSRSGCETINDMWAWPRDEVPNKENMVQYIHNDPVNWGIIYQPEHFIKWSHDEPELRTSNSVIITRNGQKFYSVPGGLDYGIDKARMIIREIGEHPLWLNEIDYDKKCIGRKVWYRSQPAIIRSWIYGQACVMVYPDGIDKFAIPEEFKDDKSMPYDPEYCESAKVDIFEDKHIWWFRD